MNEEKEDPILAAPNPNPNDNIEETKPTLTFDQRQTLLFNNPNYAVVLCFLEHFRSLFDFDEYPFNQLEENLLNDHENISRHLIDFHFALLKRISLGKGAKREKFLPIISKFAERFDWNDGESLKTNGYARADIDLKIRILKNLVECQFDLNPTFKSALLEKPSFEVRSQAFGRDRSGAFYWLFMDRECFIRIFRENVDDDRSWSFVAKDKDELEKFIILLITDHVVRKKFIDWKFVHEPFNLLPVSNEFEEKFCPPAPVAVKDEVVSDHESVASADTNAHGSSQEEKPEINNNQEDRKVKRKKKGRGRRKSIQRKKVKKEVSTPAPPPPAAAATAPVTPSPPKTPKEVKPPVPAVSTPELPLDDDSLNNDLPIALRRSKRVRKVPTTELPSVKSTPVKTPTPTPTKKKSTKGKIRQEKKVKIKPKKKKTTTASSDDEEIEPSEDEEEYNSDDYLPDPKQVDELADDDLLEEEIEDDDEYVPRRSAKTVAKRRGQLTNGNLDEIVGPSSACCICSKTDRPEALLLCDDCDDAYHLECLKPALIAVPDGDWFCPMCEHKRFAEKLIDKYLQLIKDLQELEMKKTQCISKRTNRLANVMLNLDKMVKKRRGNGIVDSDEEEEEEEEEEEPAAAEEDDEDDDNDSVYRFKEEQPERKQKRKFEEKVEDLGVRSCRRKPQNYRFDDYDKKMKEAMIEAGASADETDEESNDEIQPATTKKRASYEKDEDFDASRNKNDDEFAPDAERSDESESEEAEEDFDDEESSDGGWKSKRRTSTKRKQPTRSTRRRAKIKSEDDDESGSEFEIDEIDDRRRSTRTTTAPKNYAKQDESPDDDDDDDDDEMRRPPPKRMRNRKRLGSDDSFLGDDDYERLARKREMVEYQKTTGPRATITDRIKQLVEEEKVTTENNETIEEKSETIEKKPDDQQPSDDDDFPDEQEIFKAKSLINLKNNLNGPTPMGFRPPLLTSTHSYQHAIVDPTARFAMIRPPGQTATAIPLARTPMNNVYPSNGYPN